MSQEHDVSKMVNIYKKLFLVLVVITILGISVAYAHIPIWVAIVIGLGLMVVKSKIVYDSFKSLLPGKVSLLIVFGLTAVFFIALVLLPILNNKGHIVGTIDISKELQAEQLATTSAHGAAAHGETDKDAHGH